MTLKNIIPKKEKTDLEEELDALYKQLRLMDVYNESYDDVLSKIERLTKLKEKPQRVSYDTLANIGANSMWILLILNYEKLGIIRTKAFNFISKGRL